jgi:hypothetical protein
MEDNKTKQEILKEHGLPVSSVHSIKGTFTTLEAMDLYAEQLTRQKDERIEALTAGINYAINYLRKGGFGRMDCLVKLEQLNTEK